jgi:hypothetical protein
VRTGDGWLVMSRGDLDVVAVWADDGARVPRAGAGEVVLAWDPAGVEVGADDGGEGAVTLAGPGVVVLRG